MRIASLRGAALAATLLCASLGANAALFEDDEARRAILDLRAREAARVNAEQRQIEENAQLRRSLLELQSQIELMKSELAKQTGQNEQLSRTLSDLQTRQSEVDDKLKKSEPVRVVLDNREFTADPREKADFEAALGIFRGGQFPQAQTAFADFVKRYPQSGYNASALFWLGNAQYATRNFKEAIDNFRYMLSMDPTGTKAADAVLSIANCQIELKDTRSARKTLEDLVKTYPQTEAAAAGRERLARLPR